MREAALVLPSTIRTTDYRTAGEPFRTVSQPLVPITGTTVASQRARAIEDPGVQAVRAGSSFAPCRSLLGAARYP
jgi:hypothetical protein